MKITENSKIINYRGIFIELADDKSWYKVYEITPILNFKAYIFETKGGNYNITEIKKRIDSILNKKNNMKNIGEILRKYWKEFSETFLTPKEIEYGQVLFGILDGKIKNREETAKICNVSYSMIGAVERKILHRFKCFLSDKKNINIEFDNRTKTCKIIDYNLGILI